MDLHRHPFDEGTITKLEIFEAYTKEWLPVFVMSSYQHIYIFDLFAGTGRDQKGVAGSPVWILQQIKSAGCAHCYAEVMARRLKAMRLDKYRNGFQLTLHEDDLNEPLIEDLEELNLQGIDWVIVGGESGPKARPMQLDWVVNIKQQVERQGAAFFFKQWGTWGNDGIKRSKHANGKLLLGKVIQQMPEIKTVYLR